VARQRGRTVSRRSYGSATASGNTRPCSADAMSTRSQVRSVPVPVPVPVPAPVPVPVPIQFQKRSLRGATNPGGPAPLGYRSRSRWQLRDSSACSVAATPASRARSAGRASVWASARAPRSQRPRSRAGGAPRVCGPR